MMRLLNKDEYWLLDLVVHGSFPLYRLTDPDLELISNRDGHELSQIELLETLYILFKEGSLICSGYAYDQTITETFPTYQEIDIALRGQDYIQYRLTTKGGQQWETLSKPDWNFFLGGKWSSSENLVTIEASFRPNLEQLTQMFYYFYDAKVIYESIVFNLLKPWQAIYWKILPEGYRISACTSKSQNNIQDDISYENQKFMDRVLNWYINPFKDR